MTQVPDATPWMEVALQEAKRAVDHGDVPVGAVIIQRGKLIAQAHNEVELRGDATRHAEILTIQKACNVLGRWRLSDCEMFVTLEPCPMCTGALLLSRIAAVHFALPDPVRGAIGSLYDLTAVPFSSPKIKVNSGLCLEQSQELLHDFFHSIRE